MASKSTMTLGIIAKKSSGFREREEVSKVSNSCPVQKADRRICRKAKQVRPAFGYLLIRLLSEP